MTPNQNSGTPPEWIIPTGWVGGFEQSNPAFPYPNPDLTSLPLLENMANIDKLKRHQKAYWPEFSWETIPGQPDSRCFEMFARDISRLGYDDVGRVWSIICPQQGIWIHDKLCLNIEVSVLRQRGWVNETAKQFAADMTVEAKLWFSPSTNDKTLFNFLSDLFSFSGFPFPVNKANAMKIALLNSDNPEQLFLPVRDGEIQHFKSPPFARHVEETWSVANVEVKIGAIQKTNSELVDYFNESVLYIFNLASGNLLQLGNVLAWNLWVAAPEIVDQTEWRTHAERWRASIDEDNGVPPTGPGTAPRYFDGSDYYPGEQIVMEIEEKIQEIEDWIKNHFHFSL